MYLIFAILVMIGKPKIKIILTSSRHSTLTMTTHDQLPQNYPDMFFLFFCSFTYAQKPVVYYFSEIGLTMYIPSDFNVINAAKNEAMNQRGQKLIEDANHTRVDISETKTLIAARKSEKDYFNVTITPYDPKKDGSIDESDANVQKILFKTFQGKMPNAKIDSASGVKIVGGKSFSEFRMKILINQNTTMYMYVLSKLYKGYDLGITYLYTDELTDKQIASTLNSFKFDK